MSPPADDRSEHHHEVTVGGSQTLAVVHHEAPSDRWLVLCHGLLSDKSGSYEGRARAAVAAGYNAVRFDFRGCGASDGAFADGRLSARIEDVRSVVEHFDPDSYALFGSSFGGKVAFHVAAGDDRVEGIATRAPVTYRRAFREYRERIEREGEVVLTGDRRMDRGFIEDFDGYAFPEAASDIDVPVAIFHGAVDETVPIEDSFEAAKRLETDVLLKKFANEGHRFSERAEEQLRRHLLEWLDGPSPDPVS